MATRFEWIKLLLDKWTTIVPIFLFMGSAVGWTVTSSTMEAEKNEAVRAVAIGFQNSITEPAKPIVGKKCDCNAIFDGLIKRHVKQHKEDH